MFEPEPLDTQSQTQDSDFSLISTKYLSETLPSYGWGVGPDNLGQKGLNL